MGFQDAGGKKPYVFDYPEEQGRRSIAAGQQDVRDRKEEIVGEWEKRAPMGFQGMRGKKMLLEAIEELEKRAVTDFHVSKRLLYDHHSFITNA